jgi:hypothetical protein
MIEALTEESFRQLSQTASGIAALACAFQHSFVDIGGDDRGAHTGKSTRCCQIPKDLERIWLFARGASGRPEPRLPLVASGARCNIGQDAALQRFEDALVAEEARNRDVGQSVQDRPLFGMVVELLAIGGKSLNPEFLHPPPQALADLTMDLAEASPAQS